MRVTRLIDAPIITPDLHPIIGDNIQGPSFIRVPDWVNSPLGEYYLPNMISPSDLGRSQGAITKRENLTYPCREIEGA